MSANPTTFAEERRRTRRARFAIFLQVVLATALALAAVLLLTWLSERRGFRARLDLTKDRENTLDPVSIAVIEKLPGDVSVDVFFRAAEGSLVRVAAEAQERMRKLLRRASDESAGRIVVEEHDLSNPANLSSRVQTRMAELKLLTLEPGGLVVISAGTRREIVRLRPDIADLDPGQPGGEGMQYIPPRLVGFRGEEALVSALLKVSVAETQKVYLAQGHGEPGAKSGDPFGLTRLVSELTQDGFEVVEWDGARQGQLPADCSVLAILGPEQLLTPSEAADVERFVESGGRLVAAPGRRPIDGDASLAQILEGFGVHVRMRGVVAQPIPDFAGGPPHYETPDCGDLAIGGAGMPALNPITEPLRNADLRVILRGAHVLERSQAPARTPASLRDLLRAGEDAWYEVPLPGTEDTYDWKPDETSERARFQVAVQVSFSPRREALKRPGDTEGARPEARVVVVGAVDAFSNYLMPSNRDFVLNAFNWAASREYRVKVSRSNPEARRIDVKSEGALSRMTWIAILGLPIACALLGIATVWRRNRR